MLFHLTYYSIFSRCGAEVFFDFKGLAGSVSNFNDLPYSNYRLMTVTGVDATGSCVMDEGFRFFVGCDKIRWITLDRCK